jgi:hypothetical protein
VIVYRCNCNYIYVIDLEAAKVIGPIFQGAIVREHGIITEVMPIHVGNREKEISMETFRDYYGDCWEQLQSRIVGAGNAK